MARDPSIPFGLSSWNQLSDRLPDGYSFSQHIAGDGRRSPPNVPIAAEVIDKRILHLAMGPAGQAFAWV